MLSFEEILSKKWVKEFPYDGDGPAVSLYSEEKEEADGILFVMPTIWDEFKIVSHSCSDDTVRKLYSMLFRSNEMFNLLNSMEDPKAKELVNKILSDNEIPEY